MGLKAPKRDRTVRSARFCARRMLRSNIAAPHHLYKLRRYECRKFIVRQDFVEIGETVDGANAQIHLVFAAQYHGREIHDAEVCADGFVKSQGFETFGIWIFGRIGIVDAVNFCGFDEEVAFELEGAQGGSGIRGKIRI